MKKRKTSSILMLIIVFVWLALLFPFNLILRGILADHMQACFGLFSVRCWRRVQFISGHTKDRVGNYRSLIYGWADIFCMG